jgi:hypothetical protein
VPHYAKFLKELCTIKRKQKLKGCEKVRVGENVSAIIQRKLPAKCKDPGMFTIPCTIGNTRFENAMTDLGASINVMPYSIYAFLKLGPLKKTSVVIQLADRSITYPKGIVEDVLVQINDLVFPADFYVLDMENGDQTTPILLGRPVLKTSKTKVDVHSGTLIVSILALFCVWTKSLMCKDAVNMDSTFQSDVKLEEIQAPCQPSVQCVIPSGRPSVYCSIRPDARQSNIIRPDDVLLPFGPLHYIEKLLFQLASVRTF